MMRVGRRVYRSRVCDKQGLLIAAVVQQGHPMTAFVAFVDENGGSLFFLVRCGIDMLATTKGG